MGRFSLEVLSGSARSVGALGMEAAVRLLRETGELKGPVLVVTVLVGALTLMAVLFVQCWQPYLLRLEERLEREAREEEVRIEMAVAQGADSQAEQWRIADEIGLTSQMLQRADSVLGPKRVREILRRHSVRVPEQQPSGVAPIPWYRMNSTCRDCQEEHSRHLCCQAIGTKPRLSSHLRPAHTSGWSTQVRQEFHTGELQLISWGTEHLPPVGESGEDLLVRRLGEQEPMGWGGAPVAQAAEMRRTYHNEYEGSLSEFHDAFPSAFRWTCCGLLGDAVHGCEHHGPGCSCDYCRAGCPAPYSPTQANRFLRLANSPLGEWSLTVGVSCWTPDSHSHMPHSFQTQTWHLLLCWIRTPLPSNVVLLVLHHLFVAEQAAALMWEQGGRALPQGSAGASMSSQLREQIHSLRQGAHSEEALEKQDDLLLQELLDAIREAEGSSV